MTFLDYDDKFKLQLSKIESHKFTIISINVNERWHHLYGEGAKVIKYLNDRYISRIDEVSPPNQFIHFHHDTIHILNNNDQLNSYIQNIPATHSATYVMC